LESTARYFHESLAEFRDLGHRNSIYWALDSLGNLETHQGNIAAARGCYEEMVSIGRSSGSELWTGWALGRQGMAAWATGDVDAARDFHEEAVSLLSAQRYRHHLSLPLDGLAHIAFAEGDYNRARSLYAESLEILHQCDHVQYLAPHFELLAKVAVAEEDAVRAAHLLGAGAALRESICSELAPWSRRVIDDGLAVLRATLGDEAFETAFQEGKALPLANAVALALDGAQATSRPKASDDEITTPRNHPSQPLPRGRPRRPLDEG
jgi:tetratricopeptide (TPR) repeat protein